MKTRARAFIALGSNLGDRAANLLLAVRGMLDANLTIKTLSAIYETEPVSTPGAETEANQNPYLNMVAELGEPLPAPEQLLARLLRIEYALGRRRTSSQLRTARTIDLDLLFYQNADGTHLTSSTDFLQLPHPRAHLRRFVLVPLNEIAPDLMHPTLHQTIHDLLSTTPDVAAVKLWKPPVANTNQISPHT